MKYLTSLLAAASILVVACGAQANAEQSSTDTVSSSPQMGERLDLSTPMGAVIGQRKLSCSTIDGKDVTYHWEGRAYSRRMGERDKHIFDVEGMNIRSCTTVTDPERGTGFKLVSREILLYLDKDTGAVMKSWENPWTGEEVEVFHVANDPVNFGDYETGRDGKPASSSIRVDGDKYIQTTTVPLFYPNPLGGAFQSEVGGIYHATEMFNTMGDLESLLSADTTTADALVGWVRVSDWLPWMKMSGREGTIYFHTAGRKLQNWDQLSPLMKSEILASYPDYTTAPPDDDTRSNMTSWKDYKRIMDARKDK